MQHSSAPSDQSTSTSAQTSTRLLALSKSAEGYGQLIQTLKRQFPDLSEAELTKTVEQFKKCDLDGNGRINKDEFALMVNELKKSGVNVRVDRMLLDLHFTAADKDNSQELDLVEFITAYESVVHEERSELVNLLAPSFPDLSPKQIEYVLEMFEKFDKDGSGHLDKDEFYQLKEELAPQLSKVLLRMHSENKFDLLDKNGNGTISEGELLAAYNEVFGTKAAASDLTTSAVSAHKAWDDFVAADSLLGTRQRFEELKEVCRVGAGESAYEGIKSRVKSYPRYATFWQLIDKKKKEKEYVIHSTEKPRVLIVGAGPGGLRTAIEVQLLGGQAVVLEKRGKFTRHNLLHLWGSSIRDLKNIGTKSFYPQFCVGGIDHIAIRRLQTVLLKLALLLGAKVFHATYVDAHPAPAPLNQYWKATVRSKERIDEADLHFNVLIGAEGEHSAVSNQFGFEKKTFKGSEAIGITANFVNSQTPQEQNLQEFGLLAIYNQPFFAQFKEKYDIELENLVYYRGETHYFVMTAKRGSLLRKGVVREDRAGPAITQADNVDAAKLQAFVREVATQVGLPAQAQFMPNHHGGNDVAIFDFSRKQQCIQPAKIVGEHGCKLLVIVVGDALVEPFWPQGTGANRAILSSLDAAWMIKNFFERAKTPEDEHKLLAEWTADFKVMVSASPEDLHTNLGNTTIDPKTRYRRNSLLNFH